MKKPEIRTSAARMRPLVVGNTIFKSADDFQLTENDLEKACRLLKENEGDRNKCLRNLKERLADDTDMKYNIDDDYLLRYLRFSKYNCDRAYKMLHKFTTLKKKHPELFLLPDNLEMFLDANMASYYMPYRDEDGSVLFMINIEKWKPGVSSVTEALQSLLVVADMITMNPHCQINGLVILFDVKGFSLRHASYVLNPKIIFLLLDIFEECFPCRIKYILVFHCNRLVQSVYRLISHLIRKKVTDRVKFLGSDMNELHQYVNPAILPKQYGGALEEIESGLTQHLLDNRPFLEYQRTFGRLQ